MNYKIAGNCYQDCLVRIFYQPDNKECHSYSYLGSYFTIRIYDIYDGNYIFMGLTQFWRLKFFSGVLYQHLSQEGYSHHMVECNIFVAKLNLYSIQFNSNQLRLR